MGQNTPVEFKMDTFLAPWDQPFNMHLDQNGNVDLRARRCIVRCTPPKLVTRPWLHEQGLLHEGGLCINPINPTVLQFPPS